jgi:hypothetical protein
VADPDERGQRRYTEAEVRAILERALKHEQAREIGHDELVAAAEEIGIPRAHIEAATRDIEDLRGEEAARAAILARRRKGFRSHLFSFLVVNAFLFAINLLTPGPWWFFWPLLAWGIGLVFHAREALSNEVGPSEIRRELRRDGERARKERRRAAREEREVMRRARKAKLEQSAEEFGHAVEEGVAALLSTVAREIRTTAAKAEEPPQGQRFKPAPAPRARVAEPMRGAEEGEDEALAEEEAARGARREARRR